MFDLFHSRETAQCLLVHLETCIADGIVKKDKGDCVRVTAVTDVTQVGKKNIA